jgi:hypothetical protein
VGKVRGKEGGVCFEIWVYCFSEGGLSRRECFVYSVVNPIITWLKERHNPRAETRSPILLLLLPSIPDEKASSQSPQGDPVGVLEYSMMRISPSYKKLISKQSLIVYNGDRSR